MKRLAWATAAFIYVLMVWGNLVSATGSGMGCGEHWPLCNGKLLPSLELAEVLEWTHRLLALVAGVMVLAVVVRGFRTRLTQLMLGLFVVQVLLGMLTVKLGLSVVASSVHLIVASLILCLLIAIGYAEDKPAGASARAKRSQARQWAWFSFAAIMAQLTLGALVRHTHAGLACPAFPHCLDGFWPVPLNFETAIAFTHRWWGLVTLAVVFQFWRACRLEAQRLSPFVVPLFMAALLQFALGVIAVLGSLGTVWRVTHAALGYGILAVVFCCLVEAIRTYVAKV